MLESYCEKAQLKDGIDILDLGCGKPRSYAARASSVHFLNHFNACCRVGQSLIVLGAKVPEISYCRPFKLFHSEDAYRQRCQGSGPHESRNHHGRCEHIRFPWVKTVRFLHSIYALVLYPPASFDRILSIEVWSYECLQKATISRLVQMFEHMKNYKVLMSKVASWLRPTGGGEESLFFVHIFCHRTTPYHFEEGDGWMAQTFFSGMQQWCAV